MVPPPDRGKYDNPTAAHGTNPRLAHLHPAPPDNGRHPVTVVTEGVPDGLTVASAGYPAIAVLGAAVPDARVAARLAAHPGRLLVVFDRDPAGRAGAARLLELLAGHGRTDVVDVCPRAADLNEWAGHAGADFAAQLRQAIRLAACGHPASRPAGRGIA